MIDSELHDAAQEALDLLKRVKSWLPWYRLASASEVNDIIKRLDDALDSVSNGTS
jgi:hypothetical protein